MPGVRRDDPRRGRALVAHALNRAARDGHTVQPVELVLAALGAEGVADPPGAVAAAIEAGTVHEVAGTLSVQRLAMAESAVAEAVARLTATAEPIEPEDAGAALDDLDDTQRGAVEAVLRHGVSVLTGGPGTGKSRTVAALVGWPRSRARGRAGRADRPGGQAAGGARRDRAGGHPAPAARRAGPYRRRSPAARSGRWTPSWSSSTRRRMLDVELAAALLEACADGTHLVLVGDPAQLPSIGPGRVLADLIESGDRAGGRADHALPAGRGRRDRPAGHRGPRPASCRRSDAPDHEVVLVRRAGRPRRRTGWCSWSPTRSRGRSASRPTRCRW